MIVILSKEWRAGKEAGREKTNGAVPLDSAPPDSSDDSGQVLAKPPSRLGVTAIGDFGGKSCCTFHSGLRSSSEHRPGYCLLPHLYQDAIKIALRNATGQIRLTCVARFRPWYSVRSGNKTPAYECTLAVRNPHRNSAANRARGVVKGMAMDGLTIDKQMECMFEP